MIRPINIASVENMVFSGKKDRATQNSNTYRSNNVLKSVPLAVLIAMSPLTEPQNVYAAEQGRPIAGINYGDKSNVIDHFEYPNARNFDDCPAEVILKDENGKITVSVKFTSEAVYYNDKGIGDQVSIDEIKHLDALKVRYIYKRDKEGNVKKAQKYYLVGQGQSIRSAVVDEKGNYINKGWGYPKKEMEITKDFYEYLSDVLDEVVEKKIEKVLIDERTGKRYIH